MSLEHVKTTKDLLQWRALAAPTHSAVNYYDEKVGWQTLTWDQVNKEVCALACGLRLVGVKQNDHIAIAAHTSYAWALLDLAIQYVGAITVAIHPQYSYAEVRHAIDQTYPVILFADINFVLRFTINLPEMLGNASIYTIGRDRIAPCIGTVDDIGRSGANSDSIALPNVGPSSIATVVFSSGSSGMPKAICLTHHNLVSTALATYEHFGHTCARSLHWLPFAHMFGRIAFYVDIVGGSLATFSRGLDFLKEDLVFASPTILLMVPKALARLRSQIMYRMGPFISTYIFAVWMAWVRLCRASNKNIVWWNVMFACTLFRRILFRKIHSELGGSLQVIVVGGAPVDPTFAHFFESLGILIREGYGMTETTGVAFLQRLASSSYGNVGEPIPSIQFMIESDGELLLSGPSVCHKYLLEDQQRDAFTSDGWLRTGDVARMECDGTVSIIGRKKDIIITDGGENITPEKIESMFQRYPFIREAVICGNRRPYLVALLVIDDGRNNTAGTTESGNCPSKAHFIQVILDEINKELARFEQIRRYAVLDKPFSSEGGTMTVTLKPRRECIEQRYKEILDGLYG
jgi:long-chain acyl-CoA synthetase